MSRSDAEETPRLLDWQGWLALGWAACTGVLYLRMVLQERAPGLLGMIEHLLE